MIFEYLKSNIVVTDQQFDSIYPEKIKKLSKRHWSSIEVIKEVVSYLVRKPGTRVLDIGSGAGKFCLAGASCSKGIFTGVEYRANLFELSNKIAKYYSICNVHFIHADITEIQFNEYDAFYFYNPFHENIDIGAKIDDTVKTSPGNYETGTIYVRNQLALAPKGTRIVTYWSYCKEIPPGYKFQYTSPDGKLKFWKKI
ncbi:MAG TPA: class I SAM-dependent methyltransferase [Bacteroidia bacterium]|nr:class I SAM-dependent methyltransferase [Bacteroidia bacterium]